MNDTNGDQASSDDIDLYLTSLFNSLQEELISEFSAKDKEKLYYIYTRLQKQQQRLEMFIRLNRNSEVNKTKRHLYFIITIDHKFPTKAPYVVFASELSYPSLNDQRNFLPCLHPEWKATSKVTAIIKNMHTFLSGYLNDIENSLFIFYGHYLPHSHLYSINDFLSNANSLIRKVKIIIDMTNSVFEDYYIVLTDISLILFSIEASDKSKGKIAFMSNLRMIDGILRISLDKDNKTLENKIGFQLLWKEDSFTCDYGFLIPQSEFKEFQDEIMARNSKMTNTFYLFINSDDKNTIETLEKVIKIKEVFLEKEYDWYTFNSLLGLYQNIIELLSNKNMDQVGSYVQKLQLLLKQYNKTSAFSSSSSVADKTLSPSTNSDINSI